MSDWVERIGGGYVNLAVASELDASGQDSMGHHYLVRDSHGEAQAVTPNSVLQHATRLVAQTYHGARGLRAYEAFDAINRAYFAGELPWPLITWGLTAHGGCLGSTAVTGALVTLHPSLLGGTQKDSPWNFPPAWFGWRFALDTLLHECMHLSVNHRLGGAHGPTSHNCPEWVEEVNRLAPLLGLPVTAAMSRSKRVRDAEGPSRVTRICEASVSFAAISRFPRGVRTDSR